MSQTKVIPLDVRLMQTATWLLYAVLCILVIAAGVRWVARMPVFNIRAVQVVGDVEHHNAVTLRANVTPHITGSLFHIDLMEVRDAFESMPWVRSAVVHRVFPNRLKVELQEHQVVAFWGSESDSKLLNSFGEVFEANVGEIEQDSLPRLIGPENQSAVVLEMYQLLAPHFDRAALSLEELQLSARGSWRARLDSGTVVELGRSDKESIESASVRFLSTVTQVTSRYGRPNTALASVDLRHQNGYAIRIHGVSTLVAEGPNSQGN